MHLKVDSVNTLLNIIPGEKLLALSERFCSKFYEHVCIPVGSKKKKKNIPGLIFIKLFVVRLLIYN